MNIIFGLFVIAASLYIYFDNRPKSTESKIIFALLVFTGVFAMFGSLDFSTMLRGLLSMASICVVLIMLAAYYARAVVEALLREKNTKKRAKGRKASVKTQKRSNVYVKNAA